jgi:hypothetical protein
MKSHNGESKSKKRTFKGILTNANMQGGRGARQGQRKSHQKIKNTKSTEAMGKSVCAIERHLSGYLIYKSLFFSRTGHLDPTTDSWL